MGGPPGMAVDIGASLSWAWQKFQQNAGPLIIVMLVAFVGSIIASVVSFALRSSASGLFAFLLATAVGSVLQFVVSGFLHLGVYQSALAIADGRPVEPGKMFTTDQLGNYLVATLLYGLMVGVGFLLCILPGIVVAYLGFLTPFYVLDQRMAPVDAIRASFKVTSANVGALLGFAIVVFLVYIVGAIACLVGLLVTAPVALLAITYVFRQINGRPVAV
jgi:uncharacterized membrane protein